MHHKTPKFVRHPGIYAITMDGRPVYIGSARVMCYRWTQHRSTLRKGSHHSSKLQRAWDKYGEDAFSFEVVQIVDDLSAVAAAEQMWIDFWQPRYNVAKFVTTPMLGLRHTEETKKKMSAAWSPASAPLIGRVVPVETCAAISKRLIGNANAKGFKRPPEQVAHLVGNKRGLGYRHTDEAKAKMSASRRGVKRGPYKKSNLRYGAQDA